MFLDSNAQLAAVARVQVGIDAAVVANHHVCVREFAADGQVSVSRFQVPPTLAGLRTLTKRLSPYPGVLAVAEPTSMTWLGLAVALQDAGADLALVGSRHSARLRGAISGKNKSDVIDADVLARAGDVFELHPFVLPAPAQLALRRACTRRGGVVIDGNRYLRRLISLARCGHDPGLQERLDQGQHMLVFDPGPHPVHHGRVVDPVKARLDVSHRAPTVDGWQFPFYRL